MKFSPTLLLSHLVGFGMILTWSGCQDQPETVEKSYSPPNIVLFLVDDLGWQDTSVPFWEQTTPFNERYHTPNMERLAAEGMIFTQAYATSVCSPTRVSLMTGMNAARHRVTNWTLHPNQLQPMETEHAELEFPFWNVNGLTPDSTVEHAVYATPLPKVLSAHGYHTIHAGKAHFGAISTPGEDPLNLGFHVNIAGHAAGAPKSYYGSENFGNTPEFEGTPWPVPGLEAYHGQDIFLTEVLTREVLTALDQSTQPFFLYMAYYAVHTPIMGDSRFLQKYLDMGIDSTEAEYASMIESMDKSVGDILDYLNDTGKEDNTVILFMSDNGGLSAVARGGTPHTHNLPLASGKGSIHEGGIREPMIVKWPDKIPPGSRNPHYLIIEDFFPTILEIAGIHDYEVVQEIDGKSFKGLLSDTVHVDQDRPLYWHYPNEWGPSGPGIGAFSAIRKGPWKLIYFHLDQSMALYNLRDDIGESANLIQQQPQQAADMANSLGEYLQSIQAQMPISKETGNMIPYPHLVHNLP